MLRVFATIPNEAVRRAEYRLLDAMPARVRQVLKAAADQETTFMAATLLVHGRPIEEVLEAIKTRAREGADQTRERTAL